MARVSAAMIMRAKLEALKRVIELTQDKVGLGTVIELLLELKEKGAAPANASTGTLPPHQQRILVERTDLIEKITKLHAFFKTEIFNNLQEEDQNVLEEQVQLMMNYSNVLLKRINRF